LPALAYRAGSYATFFDTMLARLSSLSLEVPIVPGSATLREVRPLAALTTRESDDAAIAVLDAWAIVADVLTFYQERIANEGYLGTARERRSVVELARLIGYRPRPGVSASVSLAFSAALGFDGVIPKGTRAQSVPGSGESAQFFETSEDLRARYDWNRLTPRRNRPQLVTPPGSAIAAALEVASASQVDSIYLREPSPNLKSGDTLLFVFSGGANRQFLRVVETVTAQPDAGRTEVTLLPILPEGRVQAEQLFRPFIDKAAYLFPESELAQTVASALEVLVANVRSATSHAQTSNLIRGTLPIVQEQREIAVSRGFSRVTAWANHVERALELAQHLALSGDLLDAGHVGEEFPHLGPITVIPAASAGSPLGKLSAIVGSLERPPSLQPANATRLTRTLAATYSAQSDNAPRLLGALKPRAREGLYSAWAKVDRATNRIEVQAARLRASLFAHNFAGKPTVATDGSTSFQAPTVASAWGIAAGGDAAPAFVALDVVSERIKPGSWAVIDTPAVFRVEEDDLPARRTYHRVLGVRTATLEAGVNSGFAAKVTLLVLDPPWLADLATLDRNACLNSTPLLRGTAVHTQTEPLDLAEEPLDTDVQGNTIELDGLFDGLDAGRWLIVSGTRTDIPNLSGITTSELVMVAGVAQGARPPLSANFGLSAPPFSKIYYTTRRNAFGDQLVVGQLSDPGLIQVFDAGVVDPNAALPLPTVVDQQYADQVELGPGFHANAYVPTIEERNGRFPEFAGLLVDPENGVPFDSGSLGERLATGLFAWRITSRPAHTILSLASPLAYKYDARTLQIYGNVVSATHGQTAGEVLGDGDTSKAFQSLELRQRPLTYVSAPTASGSQSTLSVRVNELEWHETLSLAFSSARDRSFVVETGDDDVVHVGFGDGKRGARPPSGQGNIKASYRYGIGKAGNVKAYQVSQLATHPLGVQGVINPLRASGGADRDSRDEARRNAPLAVTSLERLVSVRDYQAFAQGYAGIDKASAALLSDGRRRLVHVTVAGKDDIPIDVSSDLYRNLRASLLKFGDPMLPIALAVRRVKLLVISAGIRLLPDYAWESVEPALRQAVQARFAFSARALGQAAFLSEAVEVMQNTQGVSAVDVECFDAVSEDIGAEALASLARTLTLRPFVAAELARRRANATQGDFSPAELAFLTPEVPETLLLRLVDG
jgi:hypothetical protein